MIAVERASATEPRRTHNVGKLRRVEDCLLIFKYSYSTKEVVNKCRQACSFKAREQTEEPLGFFFVIRGAWSYWAFKMMPLDLDTRFGSFTLTPGIIVLFDSMTDRLYCSRVII